MYVENSHPTALRAQQIFLIAYRDQCLTEAKLTKKEITVAALAIADNIKT